MIDEDYFLKQIKKASDYVGHPMKRETAQEIYNRVKFHDDRDFDAAMSALEEDGARITGPSLRYALYVQKRRRQARQEREEWMNTERKYHDEYALRSLQNIKDIMAQKKSFAQVCEEMERDFPGCGLKTYMAEEVF